MSRFHGWTLKSARTQEFSPYAATLSYRALLRDKADIMALGANALAAYRARRAA
jgi:hypothetical protein